MYEDPRSLMVAALSGGQTAPQAPLPRPAAQTAQRLAGDVVPFTGGTTWTNPGGTPKSLQEIFAAALRRAELEKLNPNPQNVIPLKRPE